ncbi:hypothetical protein EMIHUDRAFT_232852 [Emiliania huxleyi CCMP1516]|uniref:Rieske domain-containing protein n=2 Tax=Emiliania huxleyi TaxID=2903 RepID=A0A0D3K412_EMIH1|nr:hypothetical protein EMIHUDRAFT_232852 [Emiliania huxleyi CCMP1516]EOD30497.1 hypothetical protein EMIHUDRAFT_232852 [Emiliania huxleyi CCMP1516]|eukprot:XP_005782926.1 hypothetical protein EMIHUDRAFT_232852 [Emiliania huxleyi CCMP1516]
MSSLALQKKKNLPVLRHPSPPQPVTDRNGAGVTETAWLSADHSRAELVLGLDGEPYFLLTETVRPAAGSEGEAAPPTRRLLEYAIKAECTHLGCLVQEDVALLAGPGGFACPCHGSKEGEPAGLQKLSFSPKLDRSDFVLLELALPLGMLIEETADGDIVVNGAMPGYSAAGGYEEPDRVLPGDILASYTPVGKLETKRLIFRTEGATFADVRGAIASHREDDGGNGVVTLVLERAVSASTPLNQTRDTEPPRLEPLSDVILRDLKKKRVEDDLTKQVEGMSAAERTQRLLDLGFDVPPPDPEE